MAEVIRQIHEKFAGQQGIWSSYVEKHLIPRINGFELLMASYAMAHLKLDMLLTETGYKAKTDQRLRVYLTNSLEEHHPDTGTLFANWLSSEANEANQIKRDVPVMCVIGNPPYSGISINKGEWITKLIDEYKYIDGEHFNERKHWLNDDYVKFIRYGQSFVERTGEGVLAFINPHGFLDNPTFRGMRWHLLQSFDKIYIIDLHGNANKQEICPDGSPDKNVFDIQQGVSINLFIKTGKKNKGDLAAVFHQDVWGQREAKYSYLLNESLHTILFKKLNPEKPYLFFLPKDDSEKDSYTKGFLANELMKLNVTGIVTARDSLVIDINKKELLDRIREFSNLVLTDNEIRVKYFGNRKSGKYLQGDSRGWKLSEARRKITDLSHEDHTKEITYRPFDNRFIYYNSNMVDWGREKFMFHMLTGGNIGLVLRRQFPDRPSYFFLSSKIIADGLIRSDNKGGESLFPLYLYPEGDIFDIEGRKPNLNEAIVKDMAKGLGLTFTNEKEDTPDTFAPIDLLDYIYAVLHSPTYREKYKEFLKIDFPRVPYPIDKAKFWQLVKLGGEIRQIHLLESQQ